MYSRTHGNWSLMHEEMTIDAALPDWLAESNVSGVIARVDGHTVKPLRRLGVPVVDVRCRRSYTGIPQAETDDPAVAELAFNHLWERGFRRFAFCGFRRVHYSDVRLKHFRRLTAAAGCPISVYETMGTTTSISSIERAGVTDGDSLSQWLESLQPPTGLLVCNDIRGQQVLNVCRKSGIQIPDELGVIGVDDDDAICPLCDPPLSSVKPDAEQVGYRAAAILDELMNGGPTTRPVEFIKPRGVTQRLSTQVSAVEDRELARVCRFIREHACEGIDVGDIVRFSTLSRRQLERRFRAELDRTPHAELMQAQLARVKQLLKDTTLRLEDISRIAGYSHKERLGVVFKRETGLTPGEYRRQQDGPHP